MSKLVPHIPPNNPEALRRALNKLASTKLGPAASVIHAGLTLTDLTASALIGTNASKLLESVTIGTGLDYTRPTLSLNANHGDLNDMPSSSNTDHDLRYPTRAEWLQNGFPNRTDSSISFNDGSRRFTINPSNGSFDYFVAGVKYTVNSSDVLNVNYVDITDTEGPWYIYYSGSTLTATLSPNHAAVRDIYENKAVVAIVFWDADNSKSQLMEDRHGLSMSPLTHILIHETVGTRFDTGLALNSITADQDGSADSHAQFGVDAGQIFDEDIEHLLNAIDSTTGLQIWYQDTSGWTFTTNAGFSMVTTGTGRLAYDNNGTLTEVTNGDFVLCHIFATSMTHLNPVVAIGQAEYATKKLAQQGALTEIVNILSIANISPELKPVASVIFQTKDTYSNSVKARIVSTDEGNDYVDFRTDALNPAFSSAQSHGNLAGLGNDDHTQYVLHSLADVANDFLVASGTNTFAKKTLAETGAILEGDIVHDNLQSIPANNHIDHTSITLTAGTGLTGGGDISANRTFAVDGVLEDLDTLGAAASDGQFIVATGAGAFAYEATTTARTSLGVGTGDSPQFTGIELGHATDTTITRASAGNLNIEGNLVYRAGGTDVSIGDGGTGQSTAQAAIDALSAVSGATNEHVLTKDTSTGNAIWKVAAGAGSGHQYVDNVDSTIDWDHNNLTDDGTWRDLDCSGVVPVGTVAINFMVYFRHPTSAGTAGLIRKNGNVNTDNVIASYIYVAGVTTRFMGIVACDSARKCEYYFSAGMNLIGICIMGWFV